MEQDKAKTVLHERCAQVWGHACPLLLATNPRYITFHIHHMQQYAEHVQSQRMPGRQDS